MNGDNEKTFPKSAGEILISPVVISHILAHITLRPELNEVFEELFGSLGSEIKFINARQIGVTNDCNFVDIQRITLNHNAIALGIVKQNESGQNAKPTIILNPDRRKMFEINERDQVIIIDND